jgi:molybdenum cofactor cytidylyltransferase
VVASCCEGALVLPALFGRPLFPALLSLRGEEGPRRLLKTFESVTVDWPEGALDLDTPDEVLRRVGDLRVGRGTHGAS